MTCRLGLDQRLVVAIEHIGDRSLRLERACIGRPFHKAESLIAVPLAVGVDPERGSRPQRIHGAVAGVVVIAAHGRLVRIQLPAGPVAQLQAVALIAGADDLSVVADHVGDLTQ